MTSFPHRPTDPEAEALFAYGDHPDRAPANDLEATLRRVHRSAATGPATIPADLKRQIWENLMHASTATVNASSSPRIVSPDSRRPGGASSAALSGQRFWNRAANALLAAALIFALTAGIWRATGGVNFNPGGDDEPTVQFGGLVTEDDGSVDPADLPTAEDCTVEPLTVDEVLWYVTEPFIASISTDIENPATPQPEPTLATPPATNEPVPAPGPPDQADLDAAAETQRMWMACVLAGSYFQKWALEDPFFVRDQIVAVLPPLTGETEARAILEDLRDNGPVDETSKEKSEGFFISFAAMNYPGLGGIQVLDTDPDNAWQDGPNWITAGYSTYNPDGTLRWHASIWDNGRGTPVAPDANEFLMQAPFSCHTFHLTWNEARGMWLVYAAPACG